jgi:hypothetical protein
VEEAFFPLDEKLGLESYQRTTRRLERLVCEVGIRLPYEQSATMILEMLGVGVSGRQVEHIVDRHGRRAIAGRERELAQAWAAPSPIGRQLEGPEVLYVEGDGAFVNDREGLRMEGKVGVVHQGPQQVGRNRMRLSSAVYVTTFQGGQRLGQELYLEADRQGLEQVGQVVFISDGAHWLREVYQTHFYDAVYVLDWFHLQRELKRALRGVASELGDDYTAAVRMTLRDLLWFGETDLALERLDRLRGWLAGAQARDALLSLKRYVRNNRHGIHYADLYDQGLHVGSGPVEKTADLIIDRRRELRGMSWYRDTADGVCNLRALRFNPPDRWHAFWET